MPCIFVLANARLFHSKMRQAYSTPLHSLCSIVSTGGGTYWLRSLSLYTTTLYANAPYILSIHLHAYYVHSLYSRWRYTGEVGSSLGVGWKWGGETTTTSQPSFILISPNYSHIDAPCLCWHRSFTPLRPSILIHYSPYLVPKCPASGPPTLCKIKINFFLVSRAFIHSPAPRRTRPTTILPTIDLSWAGFPSCDELPSAKYYHLIFNNTP